MSTFYPEEIKNRDQVGHKEITKEETEKQAQERQYFWHCPGHFGQSLSSAIYVGSTGEAPGYVERSRGRSSCSRAEIFGRENRILEEENYFLVVGALLDHE